MLTNLLLAVIFISVTIGLLVSVDLTTSLIHKMIKMLLKWTQRSKLLTSYILKAYVHYRRTLNKPLLNNPTSL